MFPAIWGSIPPPRPARPCRLIRDRHFLGADQLAEPRAPAAAEEAWCLRRATRRVLVDDDERGALLAVLALVADRDEILDDRRAEHRRGQRPAVGLEPEQDNIAADRAIRADRSTSRRRAGSSRCPNVRLGEDRQPIARAREIALLLRRQRL